MTTATPGGYDATGADLEMPVALHDLTFLDEGDEVTVGRSDIDSYAILPTDGAALLRQLATGLSPREAAEWYAETFGEQVDMAEFLAGLAELDFLRTDGSAPAATGPVRWRRLGRAAFSPAAWVCYAALVAWCVVLMVRSPDLVPSYRNVFFSRYFTLVELVLFTGQFPLLLVHETFHALAGRRLGLRSRLTVGRRLNYLVLQTSLDGLVAVPRRQRYLPMLAGMVADLLVISALTLVAWLTGGAGGAVFLAGRICLALAFMTVLRFVWQFYFHLQTDLYHVICTTIGCVDLQVTARRTLRNRWNRLLRRPDRLVDESTWHPRDRTVARWYSWLMLVGYTASIGTLVLAGAPTAYRFVRGVLGRFVNADSGAALTDSLAFVAINAFQFGLIVWLVVRSRRRPSTTEHVLS